jgi:hypothetical protein
MKTSVLFLALALLLPISAFSQLGLKAGLGAAKAEVNGGDINWESDGLTASVHAGLFGRINVKKFYLQPEAYYTFTEAKFKNSGVSTEKIDVQFHRLDVPVLLGYRISNKLRVNAGPFASAFINTGGNETSETIDDRLDNYYQNSSYGWQAGLGIDLGRLTADLRYETTVGNLRDFDFDNMTAQDYLPDDQKQQQWLFSLGWKLGKKR